MKAYITRFKNDESGATAIEYGMIAGIISIVVITAAIAIGPALGTKFDAVATAVTGAPAAP